MSKQRIINSADESVIKTAINENIESLNRIDEFFHGEGVYMDDESVELLHLLLKRFELNMKRKARDISSEETRQTMLRQSAQAANISHKIKSFWIDAKRKKNTSER